MSNNALRSIPPSLATLARLASLSLAANRLLELPMAVLGMDTLEELALYGNPLPRVKEPFNAKGVEVSGCPLLESVFEREAGER